MQGDQSLRCLELCEDASQSTIIVVLSGSSPFDFIFFIALSMLLCASCPTSADGTSDFGSSSESRKRSIEGLVIVFGNSKSLLLDPTMAVPFEIAPFRIPTQYHLGRL